MHLVETPLPEGRQGRQAPSPIYFYLTVCTVSGIIKFYCNKKFYNTRYRTYPRLLVSVSEMNHSLHFISDRSNQSPCTHRSSLPTKQQWVHTTNLKIFYTCLINIPLASVISAGQVYLDCEYYYYNNYFFSDRSLLCECLRFNPSASSNASSMIFFCFFIYCFHYLICPRAMIASYLTGLTNLLPFIHHTCYLASNVRDQQWISSCSAIGVNNDHHCGLFARDHPCFPGE